MGETIKEALTRAVELLIESGVDNARLDAEVLLAEVLGKDRAFLHAHSGMVLDDHDLERFNCWLLRRASREPLQYIRGKQEFMSLTFTVSPAVLIPRPETEVLVETALEIAAENSHPLIADIGTGSGAIAVSLGYYLKQRGVKPEILAVDNSQEVLGIARKNALRHNVQDVVSFLPGDLLAGLPEEAFGRLDLLVSNPPYIAAPDFSKLEPEVRDYEPKQALVAGEDGLSFYRRLIPEGLDWIKPQGDILLEVGFGQADTVIALVKQTGKVEFSGAVYDLSGIPRCVRITRK